MNWQSPTAQLAALLSSPEREIADEQSMQQLGRELARVLPDKAVLTLSGELGAGKSVLARAIIHAKGYEGRVKSPTYTLIETYEIVQADGTVFRVAHLDLYRLEEPAELDYLGFDDVLQGSDLLLIEWPEQGHERLPKAHLQVFIGYADDDRRQVKLVAP